MLIGSSLDSLQSILSSEQCVFKKMDNGWLRYDVDNSFEYNEFGEVWESPKGAYLETDIESREVKWISVLSKK